LFRRLGENAENATTSEAVIADVVYVLQSKRQYGLAHGEVAARLRPILELRGLQLQVRDVYVRALDLYRDNPFDFADALTIAHMEHDGIEVLYSYDRDFDRVDTVSREEPP
jgi:predicted nucleic acid-binding protein